MERGRRNKLIIAGAAVVLILAVWAFANRTIGNSESAGGDITQTVEDVGYVRAKGSSPLRDAGRATVARLDCEVGQAVKAKWWRLEARSSGSGRRHKANLVQAEASSRSAAYRLQLAELALQPGTGTSQGRIGAVSLADYEKARLTWGKPAAVEEQEAG